MFIVYTILVKYLHKIQFNDNFSLPNESINKDTIVIC